MKSLQLRIGSRNSIDNFGVLDARGFSQQPGSNNFTAEAFRKAAAWTILFNNGIHHCLFAQVLSDECYNHRNCLPPIAMSMLGLLDPNSHFRLNGVRIVQSCDAEEFE